MPTAYDDLETMNELVAMSSVVFSDQRRFGLAELQPASEQATNAYLNSLTLLSSKRSAQHRWGRYANYCDKVDVPRFPMRPALVSLAIHDLAEGNPSSGKAYDSNMSCLNNVRKATLPVWQGQLGCEAYDESFMVYLPLKSFCATARNSANRLRESKVAAGLGKVPASRPIPPTSSTSNTPRRSTTTTSTSTSNTPRKDPPTSTTKPRANGSATPKTTVTKLAKSTKRPRAATDGESSLSDLSEDSASSEEEIHWTKKIVRTVPPTPHTLPLPLVAKLDTPSPAKKKRGPGRPPRDPNQPAKPRISHGGSLSVKKVPTPRKSRNSLQAGEVAESVLDYERRIVNGEGSRLKFEQTEQMTGVEENEEDQPVGMFGRIAKWFGWGA